MDYWWDQHILKEGIGWAIIGKIVSWTQIVKYLDLIVCMYAMQVFFQLHWG